jgi:hypothetical protein
VQDERSGEYSIDHAGVIYLMGRNGEYLGFMPPQANPDRLTEVLRKISQGNGCLISLSAPQDGSEHFCSWHFCEVSARPREVAIGGKADVARTSRFCSE